MISQQNSKIDSEPGNLTKVLGHLKDRNQNYQNPDFGTAKQKASEIFS